MADPHSHDADPLDALTKLMPTEEELRRFRESPLGADSEVDGLRMERLMQIFGEYEGALRGADGTLGALVLAWKHAVPDEPPVAGPEGPPDLAAALRTKAEEDPEFFAQIRAKVAESS